ncbi:HNH endonuclease family protein [Amycolatopsis sp. NPDC059090]|uniref:HNH endonuclease family protein n=1 Tax=unclassified Amycolatopsis TaxID=2618356 RepID=UPI00366A7B55
MAADFRPHRVAGALAAAVCSAIGGCAAVADPAPVSHQAGAGFDAAAARAALARLRVAPEDTGAHYRRADWPHWDQVAGECDARAETLKAQGTGVTTGPHCRIIGGRWTSRYDGVTVTDPGGLDIDHMVPLAEAARSGTRGWTRVQREAYANDTRLVLVAVTAKSNRAKGDQDPAKWLPALDRCGYVAQWVAVKAKYAMTVDPAEHDAIAGILRRC